MKIVLFYFSATGNTWYAARYLKEKFINSGHIFNLFSLENPLLTNEYLSELLEEADLAGIAFPIYSSALPANMQKFIDRLTIQTEHKDFFAFCTQAAFSGDGNWYFKKQLKKKGYIMRLLQK